MEKGYWYAKVRPKDYGDKENYKECRIKFDDNNEEEHSFKEIQDWVLKTIAQFWNPKTFSVEIIQRNPSIYHFTIQGTTVGYIVRHIERGETPVDVKVALGKKITFRYSLWSDGELIETDQVSSYKHGLGEVLTGIENRISDKMVGDNIKFTLPVEEAYGPFIPDHHRPVYLPGLIPSEVSVGDLVELLIDEQMVNGWIEEIYEDGQVLINFNAPLAGHELTYDITILEVS